MKIALLGASGQIGRHIAHAALARGHHVTALVRQPQRAPAELAGATIVPLGSIDSQALAAVIGGHHVLASAVGPGAADPQMLEHVAHTLLAAARLASLHRLVTVGGAGSLEIAPGLQLVDAPDFPSAYRAQALAHRSALSVLMQAHDLDWTVLAPAGEIGPGPARGNVRTQANALLRDAQGHSRISYADYADAFVSEIEQPRFIRQLATAAY